MVATTPLAMWLFSGLRPYNGFLTCRYNSKLSMTNQTLYHMALATSLAPSPAILLRSLHLITVHMTRGTDPYLCVPTPLPSSNPLRPGGFWFCYGHSRKPTSELSLKCPGWSLPSAQGPPLYGSYCNFSQSPSALTHAFFFFLFFFDPRFLYDSLTIALITTWDMLNIFTYWLSFSPH